MGGDKSPAARTPRGDAKGRPSGMTSAPNPHPPLPVRGAEPHDARPHAGLYAAITRWLWRTSVAALILSIVVHLAGLVLSGLITWGRPGSGAASGPSDGVDLAVVTSQELAELESSALAAGEPIVPESQADLSPDVLESVPEAAADGSLAEMGTLGAEGLGAAGDIGQTIGQGLGGGAGGASFFGVEAQGQRFAYIIDVSGSMGVGGKLAALRQELTASVSELDANARFLIIPFSDTAQELEGRQGWTEATPGGKRWAAGAIGRLEPLSGTEPLGGFQLALSMRPRPDAIFFMTDGEFDATIPDAVAALNKDLRVPIHCVAFVSRNAEDLMKQIAAQSGGTYAYVAGPGAP